MEDTLMNFASIIDIIHIPYISFVFKKTDIDKIANDNDTYHRLTTDKCPMSVVRKIVVSGTQQDPVFFFGNSHHASLYDDDNKIEIDKRKYISDCLEERVTNKEIKKIKRMLSSGSTELRKYILVAFLRRVLKTDTKISEIDSLIANVVPLECITTQMMSKYNLQDKLPQVELNLMIYAIINMLVPLIITSRTVRFTKRSPLPVSLRVCCRANSENIPIGNIVVLITGITAHLDDNPKYIWGVGVDRRCCRIRDFVIDLFEKLEDT